MLGPISTDPPLAMFTRKTTHPVLPKGVVDSGKPIQTNKFYSNLLLDTQNSPVFTMPYEVWFSNNANEPWGLSVDYREPELRQFGPTQSSNGASEYYINPIFIRSLHFSATEFIRGTSTLELKNLDHMSVDMTFLANKATSTTKRMEVTLVQGMGFISATYYNLVPVFQSSVLFRSMVKQSSYKTGAVKYKITLEDNSIWMLYAWTASGSSALSLQMTNNGKITARGVFSGLVQIAKLSKTTSGNSAVETIYDAASGAWSKGNTLSTTVSGSTGTYGFTFNRQGYGSSEVLMFALPHHVASFNSATTGKLKMALKYNSPTKGVMTAIVSNSWTMIESSLPTNIGWLPVKSGTPATFKPEYLTLQGLIGVFETAQDMEAVTNQDSMYFSGKSLAKYAYLCLTFSDVLNDPVNALACINKLKPAFARFAENRQIFPLVYESNTWRGIISSAIYTTGDPYVDFGSGVYNDHHFHYAYHIQTAALIGYIDKKLTGSTTWITANTPFVNTLIRDVCNPSSQDTYFPVWRSFDWFHGHSWAKGLTASWDGKDEESSSEDVNFYYSMKMWGSLIGDASMEARGNLLLGILKRSINSYMLLSTGNTNHPSSFIGNKVTGIMFENKVHHVTYFGTVAEVHKTQGIHMLPLTAISPYIRSSTFVQQEWNVYWPGGTAVEALTDGWKGVLWANWALFDPVKSHEMFRRVDWVNSWLDGGASRAWYLSFAGLLGGAAV
ncbi:glycoside hydrolase [Ascodesmis nigricans]|uniref:glucan endo-1,3-beta-D-glucosidase n=1 Tax=Ascodesmis nigricans TaxID=341454 RepID=A0A4S2MVQ8_9PEZI|nr:glycoside hydrolase [Ascodesmis nigricans]